MDHLTYIANQQRNAHRPKVQPKMWQVIVCGRVVYENSDIRLVGHYIKVNALKSKPHPIY